MYISFVLQQSVQVRNHQFLFAAQCIVDLFAHAVDRALSTGLVKNGDLTVIAAGVPVGISGSTNILKAHVICTGK